MADENYCVHWDKLLADVSEHEGEMCLSFDWCCDQCPFCVSSNSVR